MSEEDVKDDVPDKDETVEDREEAQDDNSELEARARRMGWVPEDEFEGNPPKGGFKSAEQFIKDTEEVVPLLRAQLRKQDSEISKLQKVVKDLPGKMAKMERDAVERVTAELKAKQRAAVESGDVEEYERLDGEIETTRKKLETKEPSKDERIEEIATAWQKANKWFDEDDDLNAYAQGLHGRTWDGNPDTLEENLQMIKEKVMNAFPQKFENPNRNKPGAVEGGKGKIQTKRGKSYDDLPPEAKQACDDFVEQGVMKRDEYVKEFFKGEAA